MFLKTCIISTICFFIFNAAGYAATLTVEISNARSAKGFITVVIHDGAEGFPRDRKPAYEKEVPAQSGTVVVTIPDMAPGNYAITAYHDENGNHKLDTNFIGRPSEGLAMLSSGKRTFGPPSFEDAAIYIDDPEMKVSIPLNY